LSFNYSLYKKNPRRASAQGGDGREKGKLEFAGAFAGSAFTDVLAFVGAR